jgi:CHAT domain-containing protein
VWWCATGDFARLPIHAAGVFADSDKTCASDYMVSSYIPTLQALMKARREWKPLIRRKTTALVVAEGAPGRGFGRLPGVATEARIVQACLASHSIPSVNVLDKQTSVAATVSALQSFDVNLLHLSCHGVQDQSPLDSAFILRDGDLRVRDLMQLDLQHSVLAFLSACETARGDNTQPDQAVHLAASMLFCGFRSVIATMWCVH